MVVVLSGDSLTIGSVVDVAEKGEKVKIRRSALARMERLREVLEQRVRRGDLIYGVNTGFGSLSERVVHGEKLKDLQLNLIRSHAVGVGEPMPKEVVRAAMLIRLNGMLQGNSAVRPEVALLVMGMLNASVTPKVPSLGSLGASGDLAPSAHMALTMVGEGEAYYRGKLLDSDAALEKARLGRLELEAKEGLSLINGTCFTAALACLVAHQGTLLLESANSSVALTAEVLEACSQSFDERLMRLRKVRGQARVARQIAMMTKGSRRLRSDPVPQDPYSIRCAPQVHGSVDEALRFAERIVAGEINSVTDNPVITEQGETLHGGNFHAQPVAMALDVLSIAIAYLGVLSLARVHLLLSRTPRSRRFLATEPGLESGLMVTEYTASALAAENAKEVYPISTYPANVSAGIEDHASYGVNAGLKAIQVAANTSKILAIELICGSNSAHPFDAELSPYGRRVCSFVRKDSQLLTGDRPTSGDIEAVAMAVVSGSMPHPGRA